MTIDEMEAELANRRPLAYGYYELDEEEWEFVPDVTDNDAVTEIEDINPEKLDASYGTAAYDLAYGMEEVALTSGICPQCGESVEINVNLSMACKDDTVFYDCTHTSNHKYMIANVNDLR